MGKPELKFAGSKTFAHVKGKTVEFMEFIEEPHDEEPTRIYIGFTDDSDLIIRLTSGIQAEWVKNNNGNSTPMPRKRIFE